MNAVMQRRNETNRVVLNGRRTDDGDLCTLVAIREVGGVWALYPHGVNKFGVRLGKDDAAKVARAMLAGAS